MSDSFTFTEQRLELTSAHNACKGFEYYCHICPKRALLQIRNVHVQTREHLLHGVGVTVVEGGF